MTYVLFKLGGYEYGIRVENVKEVIKASSIRPLMDAPDYIAGVVSLRHHSIAVMDIRKRLKIPAQTQTAPVRIIVVRFSGVILGLLVDNVCGVTEINSSDIDSASEMSQGAWEGKALAGVAHLDHRMILLLDADKILKHGELGELEGVGKTERQK
jgi:purine-binding chemotaxis protein CheW